MKNNKIVLVIGAAGFVGPYLIDNLRKHKYKVIPSKLKSQKVKDKSFINLDILNKEDIINVFKKYNPRYIINLAAQASVGLSWKNPIKTFDINVMGTLNILESIRELNLKTRLLLVGTSEEYGRQDKMPIKETAECKPNNFYALSKLTQESVAQIYIKNYNLDIVFTRSFNHIGQGQGQGFVVPDFCKQIIDIKNKKNEPIIYVGNLNVKRDFSDVKNIVEGYRLLLEKGKTREIYNVGSGRSISIRQILNMIIKNANIKVLIKEDKTKFRPNEIIEIKADTSKFYSITKYKFDDNLNSIIKNILKDYNHH